MSNQTLISRYPLLSALPAMRGTVHIWEVAADGKNQTVRESFDTVPLVILYLERMFPVKNE
jgi:hypothetical protein